jgi:hypothetical protein
MKLEESAAGLESAWTSFKTEVQERLKGEYFSGYSSLDVTQHSLTEPFFIYCFPSFIFPNKNQSLEEQGIEYIQILRRGTIEGNVSREIFYKIFEADTDLIILGSPPPTIDLENGDESIPNVTRVSPGVNLYQKNFGFGEGDALPLSTFIYHPITEVHPEKIWIGNYEPTSDSEIERPENLWQIILCSREYGHTIPSFEDQVRNLLDEIGAQI